MKNLVGSQRRQPRAKAGAARHGALRTGVRFSRARRSDRRSSTASAYAPCTWHATRRNEHRCTAPAPATAPHSTFLLLQCLLLLQPAQTSRGGAPTSGSTLLIIAAHRSHPSLVEQKIRTECPADTVCRRPCTPRGENRASQAATGRGSARGAGDGRRWQCSWC